MGVLPLRGIAVVVPVRNEEALLGRCLRGVHAALARLGRHGAPPLRTTTVLVLDSCEDGSEAIAVDAGAMTVLVEVENVGLARAVGVRTALRLLPGLHPEEIWIANTDADSLVPRDWLVRQRALADAGWDVVLGRVAPDLADLPEPLRGRPAAVAAIGDEPVYGANLGVRAAAYLAAGGFAAAREHEDQLLVAALRRGGARVTSSPAAPVLTSGRVAGRTPGGYAGFLRDALQRIPPGELLAAGAGPEM